MSPWTQQIFVLMLTPPVSLQYITAARFLQAPRSHPGALSLLSGREQLSFQRFSAAQVTEGEVLFSLPRNGRKPKSGAPVFFLLLAFFAVLW
jgi:hypothetical protein